jgi:hypothetical protein
MSDRAAWDDSKLCTAHYPGTGADAFALCDQSVGHPGDHRALAEVAFNYRRFIVWTADGIVMPDVKTVPHDHEATDTFDPTCLRCREGWQAAYDQAQCDYLEAQFVVGQTPPSDGDRMT